MVGSSEFARGRSRMLGTRSERLLVWARSQALVCHVRRKTPGAEDQLQGASSASGLRLLFVRNREVAIVNVG